ncbi:MAG TPA: LacI family DNA-binding transcriptional regulator [Candidatus Competibacteraceae bacterium]|nr:LacI family DNA-binding transcriptional regulator [Candidatus Competibacteraceae bacterium]
MTTETTEETGAVTRRKATIIDIADHAGVSRSTVSLVLRGSPLVKAETRQRVLAAIEELGYVYHRAAANLRQQHSQVVGLVINELTNPFFTEVTVGLEAALSERQYLPFLTHTDESLERQERLLTALREYDVAGVVLCPVLGTGAELPAQFRRWQVPLVLVMRHLGDPLENYVGTDDYHGSRLATEHLIGLGHQRLAYIGGVQALGVRQERVNGFRDALATHGLDYRPDWVLACSPTRLAGRNAAQELLGRSPAPTAIVCFNDAVALGVMHAVAQSGRSVGRDCAVVGFDNIADAALVSPGLTTVSIEPQRIGRVAAQLLLELIRHPEQTGRTVLVPPQLVIRQSCGAH